MKINHLTPKDSWRGIILLGLNTATYKLALANCLIQYAEQEKIIVPLAELAQDFFDLYLTRLENGKPQLVMPNRLTVMERIVEQHRLGKLTREQAILRVEKEAFSDVIPRFHKVDNEPVPTKFYEHTQSGLIITDDAFSVLSGSDLLLLKQDVASRWDLLEAAFEMRRSNIKLQNDIRKFYFLHGHERTNITYLRPVLDGYQQGICFYCGEAMTGAVDVDHVIPRQVICNDDVWNLVLTHEFCNQQKSDYLPSMAHIEQLLYRNEFFIKSNHPLAGQIINALGAIPSVRTKRVLEIYKQAQVIIGSTWEGVRGYNPREDPLYLYFVRSG
jgi:hypothetical protein